MRLIAPFGFYGWGNIGDESTLQGFARLLARSAPGTSAWVGARDVAQCRRAEPAFRYFSATVPRSLRRRFAWERAQAMVVPGGTPIMDTLGGWPLSELIPHVERATAAGKPVAFIGTGTERLRTEESRKVIRDVLAPRVDVWTVRSDRDRERLLECGVAPGAVTAAADLAWGIDAASSDFGRSYLGRLGVDPSSFIVGVNVNIEAFVREQQPRMLTHIAALLDHMVDTLGAHIVFLCNEVREGSEFDLAASREVIGLMRHSARTTIVPNEYWVPQAMMSLVSCCRLTLSTRYHFCLFSAVQGVPFLAVQRSNKVADLCADLGWSHGATLDELGSPQLATVFSDMATGRDALVHQLQTAVLPLRERSARNAVALTALAARLERGRA